MSSPYQIKHVILISGISGSGKTVAISCLEDLGYYCVDNLPPTLIAQLLNEVCLQNAQFLKVGSAAHPAGETGGDQQLLSMRMPLKQHIAIGVDIRSGSLLRLPEIIIELKKRHHIDCLFLDADDEVLLKRFSETRRKHPVSHIYEYEELNLSHATATQHAAPSDSLLDCLQQERIDLSEIKALAYALDTSQIKPAQLKLWMKDWLQKQLPTQSQAIGNELLLTIQSFGFKHGTPKDCDFIFDVRHLPNPYYEDHLRKLTGLDAEVIEFLQTALYAQETLADISHFINKWLPIFVQSGRAYLTIGIGCTGGQHRSVYMAQALAKELAHHTLLLVRHRCL